MERETGRECARCLQLEERIAELRSELMVTRIALMTKESGPKAGAGPHKNGGTKTKAAAARQN